MQSCQGVWAHSTLQEAKLTKTLKQKNIAGPEDLGGHEQSWMGTWKSQVEKEL